MIKVFELTYLIFSMVVFGLFKTGEMNFAETVVIALIGGISSIFVLLANIDNSINDFLYDYDEYDYDNEDEYEDEENSLENRLEDDGK